MIGIRLNKIYYLCDKIILRTLRTRRNVVNPGLNKRLEAFRKEGIKIVDNDAEEFLEQSESDMYEVGEAYNEHLNETLIGKYKLRHHIVKQKYFKENMPNLLTWSEKEQIRHLVQTQPDEWTPERIAESFPVTVQVVKKLLKYVWKPSTEQRIARHDASAMRNWRELKEGTLDIPQELREHFLKFSDRTIPPLNKKSLKVDLSQERLMGEFEEIIRKCATKENENNQHNNEEEVKSSANEKHETNRRYDKTKMTLDELTAKIKKRIESGKDVNMPDQIILKTVNSDSSDSSELTPKQLNNETELNNSNESKDMTEYKIQDESISVMDYPERIRIPKKAYKKGATYKVNDCFYDHDGRFLYRVLGLSN